MDYDTEERSGHQLGGLFFVKGENIDFSDT